jgi:hypothetical protein
MAEIDLQHYIGGQVFYSVWSTGRTSHRVWHRSEIAKIVQKKEKITIHCSWVGRLFVATRDDKDETDDRWEFDGPDIVKLPVKKIALTNGVLSVSSIMNKELIMVYLYPNGHKTNIVRQPSAGE